MAVPAAALMAQIHKEAFDTPWDETAFASLLASPGVAAIGDNRGFILIRTTVDESEILTVAVLPSQRRAGVGRELVEKSIVCARVDGADRMFLEVAESNVAARKLYEGCGFETVGRRRDYYHRADGSLEDALLMALNFSQ